MTVDETRELVARLVKRHGSAERVAALLKGAANARSVLRHAQGESKPSAKLVKKYVAIDAKAARATPAAEPAPAPATVAFDRSRPTLEAVVELASRADAALNRALTDPNASHRDRAAAVHACARALRDLAVLRGELEPTEASILRSAAWSRCVGVIVEVLRGYPEAARAVSVAIDALEETTS